MDNDPIQWGRTTLAWSPDGYRLTLTVWLDARASALFEERVGGTLERFGELADGPAPWEFEGGYIERSEHTTSAEPAVLTITAPRTLFAVDTAEFRSALSALAHQCRREADEQHQRDEAIANEWLSQLTRE